MTYPDQPIQLDLDPSGYIQGLGQAERTTDQFGASLRTAALAVAPLSIAMNSVTPSRAALAGVVGFTAVASKAEQQLSTLRATTRTTSKSNDEAAKSFGALTKNTKAFARELPIGNAGARELVTTMSKMGVVTKGNEQSFVNLAKTFTRLGGATGEGPAGLAQGMIQLSRATGTGLSTARVEKLSDSLTTVAAKSGASATGILAFSKNIAPLANAAGIGQTKILGISAAFSKMGEDGFGAANAFNKMLGDMNRSVREGSPEMSKYAQIVGKSADEFTRMFKADPTEAITQVTEAIGAAGAAGPRMLEQLGLEGVRTQKALQQLSAGGNLRTAVSDATGAYGSGSTKDAAAAAFGGLADSTTRLGTAAEQAAEAIGTPFLSAVTKVTDVIGGATSVLAQGLDSKPVQKTLGAIAAAALPLLIAFKAIPALISALGLSRLATSGPIKALMGGYAASGAVGSRLAGRLGGDTYNRTVAGLGPGERPGSRLMAPINERAANMGGTAGGFVRGTPGDGPGTFRAGLGGMAQLGAAYMRVTAENVRNARTPFNKRTDAIAPRSEANKEFASYKKDLDRDLKGGRIDRGEWTKQLASAGVVLARETGSAGVAARMLGREFRTLMGQTAATSAAMGGRAAKGIAGALGGPVGMALAGITAGFAIKSGADEETRKRQESAKQATGFLDDYRVAMGKATEATSTFAGAMNSVTKSNAAKEMTADEAKKVTEDDMRAFGAASTKDRVRDYRGMTDAGAARRIQGGVSLTGASPDEIQRIQQDLKLSGFSRPRIEAVTADIPSVGKLNESMGGNVAGQVSDIGKMSGRKGIRGFLGRVDKATSGENRSPAGSIDTLGKGQINRSDELVAEINERKSRRAGSGVYSEAYAQKEQFSEIDQAVSQAFKDGNQALAEKLMLGFQETNIVGDKNKGRKFTLDDIKDSGGFYTSALADLDKDFGGVFKSQKEAEGRGEATDETGKGWVSKNLGDNPLAELFSAKGSGQANDLVKRLMVNPESPVLKDKALAAAMAEQQAAGGGDQAMITLADNATKAANKLGQLDDATIAFLGALRSAAQFQVQSGASYRSSGETRGLRTQMAANDARLEPRTDEQLAQKKAGRLELLNLRDEEVGQAKQILAQRRELQVQQGRMEVDFKKQRRFMDEDYDRSTLRAEEQYGVQLVRSDRAYQLARSRSEEDYQRSKERSGEDFQRGQARATQDYQRSQMVAFRDFNKSMTRLAEDGARGLYDAYTRIQVQPTWDAWNLAGNLEEQNRAVQEQINNLGKLRMQGGSMDLIKLMGLNDPKNAQQLANLVSDAVDDPAILGRLNAAAAERQSAGGLLVEDSSNTQRERAVEDFKTQLADQSVLFKQMMDRSSEDFRLMTARGSADYKMMMQRGAADYRVTLQDMAADQARSIRYAAEERATALERFEEQQKTTLARMNEDVKRADEEIVTDLAGYTRMLTQMIDGQIVEFDGKTKSTLDGTLDNLRTFQDGLEKIIIDMGPGLSITVEGRRREDQLVEEQFQSGARRSAPAATGGGGDLGVMTGRVSSEYGMRNGRLHAGIDIASPIGTDVLAYRDGTVTLAGAAGGYGNAVYIDHGGGRVTRYGHLNSVLVQPGDQVKQGEHIAESGNTGRSTGPHLHFETRVGGSPVNPRLQPFAMGGIATRPTEALIAEAGTSEAIIPLNERGVQTIADAMKRFMTPDQARGIDAGRGITYVTYDHSTKIEDHSQQIAKVEVHGVSMDDAMQQARVKAAQSNLTAPPQRKRS